MTARAGVPPGPLRLGAGALVQIKTAGVVQRGAQVLRKRPGQAVTNVPIQLPGRGLSRDPGLTLRRPDQQTGRRRRGSATIGPLHRSGVPGLTDRMLNLAPSRRNELLKELITVRVPRIPPLVLGKAIKVDAGMLGALPHPLPPGGPGHHRAPRGLDPSGRRSPREAPGPPARLFRTCLRVDPRPVVLRPGGATVKTSRGAEGQRSGGDVLFSSAPQSITPRNPLTLLL